MSSLSQCWRILRKIPGSASEGRWFPKFNQFFLVHRYICGKIFVQQFLRKVANRQTNRQTPGIRAYITSLAEVILLVSVKAVLLLTKLRTYSITHALLLKILIDWHFSAILLTLISFNKNFQFTLTLHTHRLSVPKAATTKLASWPYLLTYLLT